MALPPHAADWMNRAEIDYIGPFVKAWAAFNAWFRHASAQAQERAMLDWVKSQPNPVRRGVLALLRNDNDTAEAQALKLAISDLQMRLDAIHFEVTRKGENEQISLRSVCIAPKHFNRERIERSGQEYKAEKVAGGNIEITVTSVRSGNVKFLHVQAQYQPNAVYGHADFTANLSNAQQTTLRQFYDGCNPRPMRDLLRGGNDRLHVGAMEFRCTTEELLSGLIETIYAMRNALLHGEVDPDPRVLACYEPAYRIVMMFLHCAR
ncbi:hypothetical protein [Denitromonas iodatirespirans]|uniref:Apea-like HEPN domain-containing protein n=1 Tax=Denitromonas iodatirespirans TaxID=2795389 RepID=A0A944HA47_DENI1|nr:hypothetical protein [Denitromonas iodatirespirans]MBT0964163.1 hypothetical protein [Denitromonas iodatirespirans]